MILGSLEMMTEETRYEPDLSHSSYILLQMCMIGFLIGILSNLLLLLTGFATRIYHYPWLGGVDSHLNFTPNNTMIHGLMTLVSSLLIGIGFVGHWKIHRNPLSLLTSLAFIASTATTLNWIYYLPDLGFWGERLRSLYIFETYWPLGTVVLLLAISMAGFALIFPWRGMTKRSSYAGMLMIGFVVIDFVLFLLVGGIGWIPLAMMILILPYLFGLGVFLVSFPPGLERLMMLTAIAVILVVIIAVPMMALFPS